MASCGPHFRRNGRGSPGPMVAVGYRNPGFSSLRLPLSNHLKLSHLGVTTELYGPLCPALASRGQPPPVDSGISNVKKVSFDFP